MNNKYFYGMRSRGFSIGTQPKEGLIGKVDASLEGFHDIIAYDRPLTEEEEKRYTLIPLYAYEYSNNLGDDYVKVFNAENDRKNLFEAYHKMTNEVTGILQLAYDEFCKTYLDSDVTWENKLLLFGDESEVYVPNSDCYEKVVMYSPITRIKDYIKSSHYPIRINNLELVLLGVNMHENADTEDAFPCAGADGWQISFRERYGRARDEIEKMTRKMTTEQAKEYFEQNASGDEDYFYGKYFYIYTKKKSPKYIAFGIRMD